MFGAGWPYPVYFTEIDFAGIPRKSCTFGIWVIAAALYFFQLTGKCVLAGICVKSRKLVCMQTKNTCWRRHWFRGTWPLEGSVKQESSSLEISALGDQSYLPREENWGGRGRGCDARQRLSTRATLFFFSNTRQGEVTKGSGVILRQSDHHTSGEHLILFWGWTCRPSSACNMTTHTPHPLTGFRFGVSFQSG